MKNLIEWTPDLAVNIPAIDDQHKELYSRMNDLCNAIMEGKGRNEVGSFVRYLSEYTTFHFEDEEALMRQHEYPGYDAQSAAHRLFRERVRKMAAQADPDVIASDLVVTVVNEMKNWFSNHIRTMDKQIGDFIAAAG
ncbi:MAG: bacteriohemerythrin [Desulfomonilaceae bacterium]